MSIITGFTDTTQKHELLPGYSGYIVNVLDFSAIKCAAADVVQALKVAAGMLVSNVRVVVLTAQGATCTATVGDGDAAAGYDGSTNLNATANTVTAGVAGTDASVTAGKYYAVDDTIDLTLGHTTDAAKIAVIAEYTRIPSN